MCHPRINRNFPLGETGITDAGALSHPSVGDSRREFSTGTAMVIAYFLMASALWVHSGGMRPYECASPVRDVSPLYHFPYALIFSVPAVGEIYRLTSRYSIIWRSSS